MLYAENAYLFRHAITRDAAYQMQLPSQRAASHRLAFHFIEATHGGRAPDARALDAAGTSQTLHQTDAVATELAYHARLAGDLSCEYRLYLTRAGFIYSHSYQLLIAARVWEELSEVVTGVDKAKILHFVGRSFLDGEKYAKSVSFLLRSIHFAKIYGSKLVAAHTLVDLAYAYGCLRFVNVTERLYRVALAEFEKLGAVAEQSNVNSSLSAIYWSDKKPELAEEYSILALSLARKCANRGLAAKALSNLSVFQQTSGRLELAEKSCTEAMAIVKSIGSLRLEATVSRNFGLIHYSLGRLKSSTAYYNRAIELFLLVQSPSNAFVTIMKACALSVEQGRVPLAKEYWAKGMAILPFTVIGNRFHDYADQVYKACEINGIPPFKPPE